MPCSQFRVLHASRGRFKYATVFLSSAPAAVSMATESVSMEIISAGRPQMRQCWSDRAQREVCWGERESGLRRIPADRTAPPSAAEVRTRVATLVVPPFLISPVPLPVGVWPWLAGSGTRSWPESPWGWATTRTPLVPLSTSTASPGTSAPAPAAVASWTASAASGLSCVSGAASCWVPWWYVGGFRDLEREEKWVLHYLYDTTSLCSFEGGLE